MERKHVLCEERTRRVPRQFSWVDHRLVRDGFIRRCDPTALALYLLLITVGDAEGLSFYSDRLASRLLGMSPAQLEAARERLVRAELIAYVAPMYQVLELPEGGAQ
jgi:hypothetical protein